MPSKALVYDADFFDFFPDHREAFRKGEGCIYIVRWTAKHEFVLIKKEKK